MNVRTRKQALTEGVTAGILFGTAAIFVRFLPDLSAFAIAFWRLVIGFLALAAVSFFLRKPFHGNRVQENLKDLFILSVLLGFHFIFFTLAVKDTTILNATVLVNMTPIFSMLMSIFIFKVRPSRFAVAGLLASFIGICLIAYGETITSADASKIVSPSPVGDLEAILAALLIAFYLSYGKKVRKQMTVLSSMVPIYAFAAIIVGVFSVPTRSTVLAFSITPDKILPLIGLGLLPTTIAHTLYFSSLSNLRSFETATMAFLEPVGATMLGITVFHEVPSLIFVLGAALVLTGIFFIIRNRS